MIAGFLDNARELRSALVVGYAAVATVWIWIFDRLPDESELGKIAGEALRIWRELGGTGQTAALSFFAAMLGSWVLRLRLFSHAQAIVRNLRRAPDWSGYIADARQAASLAGSVDFELPSHYVALDNNRTPSPSTNRVRLPARTEMAHHERAIRERETERSDADFRQLLALSSIAPVASLAIRAGGAWWALLAVPAFLVADLVLIDRSVHHYILSARWSHARQPRSAGLSGIPPNATEADRERIEQENAKKTAQHEEHLQALRDRAPRALRTDDAIDEWASQFRHSRFSRFAS